VRTFLSLIFVLSLASPPRAFGEFLTSAEELAARDVDFTWSEAKTKSLKIVVEHRSESGGWQQLNIGSGFLISPDGLFITAYHVMKFCLETHKETDGLAVNVDCSDGRDGIRYRALNGDREFEIQVVSHLNEADSTNGKDKHTPDEIIKQRDFVVGKLKGANGGAFPYWKLRDFDAIDLSTPRADFQLMPLLPPKKVFITGFPKNSDFVISEGFLNLTEKNRRGYFAADYKVYTATYLQSLGVAADTRWGMGVRNHMSGGPVVDSAGFVVGVVVNGNRNTAGILSIENVLSTFFSRAGGTEEHPAVVLNPAKTPLYLKGPR
jgi:S1-C subfamily serine protease